MEAADVVQVTRGLKKSENINWITTTAMVAFHIGAIAALFMFSWKNLLAAFVLWWIAGSLGIGLGYHRLLTHRGFKVPKWLEYFFTFCATLALEGGPIFWVAVHRIHHQNTDKPGDPHSPRDGKWWSHMGWILLGETLHENTRELMRYTPDLAKDKFHVLITKWHWIPMVMLGFALLGIGTLLGGWHQGVALVCWGVFLRTVFGLHSTWLVNSATHLWGSRRFATKDDSTNNFWVALVTFGEGWHNNHHAHPTSARHGIRWYEIDTNWYVITVLKKLRLATGVKALSWPLPASAMRIGLVDVEKQEAEKQFA
jgi:stearoyl-CoA desaturase (delta-9 desaturase)